MKIAIIGAMDEEIVHLAAKLKNKKKHKIKTQNFITGNIGNHEVVILKCGIGKVNAAVGATLLLNLYNPHYVINTGAAGGLSKSLNVGDIIISSEVRYHDVDLTAFGYEFGQMAKMPASYLPSKTLVDVTKKCIQLKSGQNKIVHGLIVSGDSFINNSKQTKAIRTKLDAVCAVEMEACAIAHVCHLFETPFIIIRSISDTPNSNNSNLTFKKFLTLAARESAKLVLTILKDLGSNPDN